MENPNEIATKMRLLNLPVLVSQYYEMDPATEIFLYDGSELKNGMIVLLADPDRRWDYNPDRANEPEVFFARERNRWAHVSRVVVEGNEVSFLATYDDGVQARREYSVSVPWLAKDGFPSE